MLRVSSVVTKACVLFVSLIALPVTLNPSHAAAGTFSISKVSKSGDTDPEFAAMIQDYMGDALVSSGHVLLEKDTGTQSNLMLRFYRAGDDHIVQLKLLENGSVVRSTSVRVDSESDAPELVCRRLVQVVVDGKSKSEITQVGTLLESDQNDKALQRVLPARSAFGLAIGPTAILERKAVSLKGNLTNFSFHLDEAKLGMVIEASFLTGERGYDATSLNFGLQKYFSRHTHSLFAGGSMGGVIWDNDSHVDTMSHKANEGMYHHVGEEHRGYSLSGWFGGEVGRLSTMSLLGMARVTVLQEFRTGSKTLVLPGVFVGIKIRRVP